MTNSLISIGDLLKKWTLEMPVVLFRGLVLNHSSHGFVTVSKNHVSWGLPVFRQTDRSVFQNFPNFKSIEFRQKYLICIIAFLGNMFIIHISYSLKPYLSSQLNLHTRIFTMLLLNQLSATDENGLLTTDSKEDLNKSSTD